MNKIKVTSHSLVPKHIKVGEKEKQVVFSTYSITFKELPKIYRNDPAIQNMKVRQGDIIKIIRKSATAGEFVFYRGVIDA